MEEQLRRIKAHSFDPWAKEIMHLAAPIDPWIRQWLPAQAIDPYRAGEDGIAIEDNGEPLVYASEYGLLSGDYYLTKLLDQLKDQKEDLLSAFKQHLLYPGAWIREGIAKKLQSADTLLRSHDMFLFIDSGWRHPEVQRIAISQYAQKYGQERADMQFASVEEDYHTHPTPHATGGVCDIKLYSLQTNEPLSYTYPGCEQSLYVLEEQAHSDEEKIILGLRRVLFHVLTTPSICFSKADAFTILPHEFWHFGFGDPVTTLVKKEKTACYGFIEPSPDFSFHHRS